MSRVIVVGGGASGMMAGALLGNWGHEVHVFEHNEKLGKKLFITGKGRCNLTNNCEPQELLSHVVTNPKFLYSAFYSFTSRDVMEFFEKEGLALKTERGNRVFPVSDRSSDVIRTLEKAMRRGGVTVHLNTGVSGIITGFSEEITDDGEGSAESSVGGLTDGSVGGSAESLARGSAESLVEGSAGKLVSEDSNDKIRAMGVKTYAGDTYYADAVIVAAGGLSYPSTGSTGDGYTLALDTGHRVTDTEPSLVPLLTAEEYIPEMQGLSLKNTGLSIKSGKKKIYDDFGEMMFTHKGVTGPMILSASAVIGKYLKKGPLNAYLDLKPALTPEKLDERILREFGSFPNRQFRNVIGSLFPSLLTPVIIRLSEIAPEKRIHEITREERTRLVQLIKAFPFTITGKGEYREAVITKGGVSVKDIDPGTMESKHVKDLYFIGEVLDVDAMTGGFNLQIAWSTAYLAAKAIE
ncbi:MAG: NAD(P)/FAD-dependent oxidoreductase [Blautia sp.]|nr:NAD(P)/FAD-dependent oxidoreductase [Blautia sp.]